MKKIILLISIFAFTSISCKAQHIIPVEDGHKYIATEDGFMGDKDYVYVKDINNYLSKFVGTWKGIYNAKNYEFTITKSTTDDGELKEDILLMRYKITDTNGTIIENTLLLPNDSPFVMKNGYVAESGSYVFAYIGKNNKCGQNGWVFMRILSNSNNKTAKLFLQVEGETYPSCITGTATQILPTNWVDLAKH